ncbi:hypothetical protein MNBD_ALPHA01-1298 [hydrothermal vent metagenome]|uniref:Uncharacterized protein n=1 Tax=hydrothermal vent metagenome TaxID=652676 RepID=A0A3B0S9U0_9ZZZZ
MAKDNGELLLDGLVLALERAQVVGNNDLSELLGDLYQVAGLVVFDGPDGKADSLCARDILKRLGPEK